MKSTKADFFSWFQDQCGERPGGYWVEDKDLRELVRDGGRAQKMLDLRREWDRMRTAALWAWQYTATPPADEEEGES